jgi:hypothetical protein
LLEAVVVVALLVLAVKAAAGVLEDYLRDLLV